jgi:hypothetical protein
MFSGVGMMVRRSVELRANFLPESIYDELLAVVVIETDAAEPWGDDHFRRKITARVEKAGPLWDRFMKFWGRGTVLVDGLPYLPVRGLTVDHDFYPFMVYLNFTELPTLRILVAETFRGSVEEYFAEVRDRNERVPRYREAWDNPQLTGNDLRELTGVPRLPYPHLDEPLDQALVTELRESFKRNPSRDGLWRNMVI